MNDHADRAARGLRKGASLLALALAACFASSAAQAQAQLRAHWMQEIEEEATFVGVLSRAEDEDIRYVDLRLEMFSNGISLGTEVHRIEFAETVELFSLPVEEGIDCVQVESVVGLDSQGYEVPGGPAPAVGDAECSIRGPRYF